MKIILSSLILGLTCLFGDGVVKDSPKLLSKVVEKENKWQKNILSECVDRVISDFSKAVEGKYGVKVRKSDFHGLPSFLDAFTVDVFTYREGTIEIARELAVNLKEIFVETINQSTELRPFLKEHPFPKDNAQVHLTFKNENGELNTDGSIAKVLMYHNNTLYYFISTKESSMLEVVFQEPYLYSLKRALSIKPITSKGKNIDLDYGSKKPFLLMEQLIDFCNIMRVYLKPGNKPPSLIDYTKWSAKCFNIAHSLKQLKMKKDILLEELITLAETCSDVFDSQIAIAINCDKESFENKIVDLANKILDCKSSLGNLAFQITQKNASLLTDEEIDSLYNRITPRAQASIDKMNANITNQKYLNNMCFEVSAEDFAHVLICYRLKVNREDPNLARVDNEIFK